MSVNIARQRVYALAIPQIKKTSRTPIVRLGNIIPTNLFIIRVSIVFLSADFTKKNHKIAINNGI